MVELVDAGLVRAIGMSNYNISEIECCHTARAVDVVQDGLSLVDHLENRSVALRYGELGIGVTIYEPLASGVLLRSPGDDPGRGVASLLGRRAGTSRCTALWPGDLRDDGGGVAAPATGTWPDWMPDWMIPFSRTIDGTKKYVVSGTLDQVDWNAELVQGDLKRAVQQLKLEPGKGLFVSGVTLALALADLGVGGHRILPTGGHVELTTDSHSTAVSDQHRKPASAAYRHLGVQVRNATASRTLVFDAWRRVTYRRQFRSASVFVCSARVTR